MKPGIRILGGLLVVLAALSRADAGDAAQLAREDWEAHLEELKEAAEGYLREATQGTGDIQVNEVGYLRARRYYRHVLLLSPNDPGGRSSREILEAQLARFRRQHRWQLLRVAVVSSIWGSPSTRYLNDGRELGVGRTSFDVEADVGVFDEVFVKDHWTLTYGRRRLPFLVQTQVGVGTGKREIAALDETDLVAAHASAEIDYAVLPMFRYLLPYAGVGYRGMVGYYDDFGGSGGDFFFHGTYVRLGAVLSLKRNLKIAVDYGRSLKVYGSEFSASEFLAEIGVDSCKDCVDSWTATQISVEFVF